jgi:hypothetical protein
MLSACCDNDNNNNYYYYNNNNINKAFPCFRCEDRCVSYGSLSNFKGNVTFRGAPGFNERERLSTELNLHWRKCHYQIQETEPQQYSSITITSRPAETNISKLVFCLRFYAWFGLFHEENWFRCNTVRASICALLTSDWTDFDRNIVRARH